MTPRPLLDGVRERDGKCRRAGTNANARRVRHPLEAALAGGDRVQAAEIVQQPAVEAGVDERAL